MHTVMEGSCLGVSLASQSIYFLFGESLVTHTPSPASCIFSGPFSVPYYRHSASGMGVWVCMSVSVCVYTYQ